MATEQVFIPLDKMWTRVEIDRQDSDASLFHALIFLGEMLTKVVASGLIAAIDDDRERHRYRQLHRVIRADGIGEWASVIEDVLTGPSAQYLRPEAAELQRELTQRLGPDSWQHKSGKPLVGLHKTPGFVQ